MIGFRKWVAGAAVLVMAGAQLAGPARPAAAALPDPTAAPIGPSAGFASMSVVPPAAALASLSITGSIDNTLAPAFNPDIQDYWTFTPDTTATISAAAQASGAAVTLTVNAATRALDAAAPLVSGRNDAVLTVTNVGASATAVYRVAIWSQVVPTAEVVGISNATTTVLGGALATVTLRDGEVPESLCTQSVDVGGREARTWSTDHDPTSGLTRVLVQLPGSVDHEPGTADLQVGRTCYTSEYPASRVTVPGAITYTDDFEVESADIPNQVTGGSVIVLRGHGVLGTAEAAYWIEDDLGRRINLPTWDTWNVWPGEDNATIYVRYPDEDHTYENSGVRTLHVGACGGGQGKLARAGNINCQSLWSTPINWVAPAPADLTFSPSAGSTAGGTKIRLKGRFLTSRWIDLELKMGALTVGKFTEIQSASDEQADLQRYSQGYDIVEFEAPPNAVPGPVQITATSEYGSTVARGTFTYAAKPTIASLSPATVANSGGSVITVQGSGFGSTGRPTVIIDGIRSPSVTRISTTTLTAVVPATSSTGPVDVQVSSAQGGGVSTPKTLTLVAPSLVPTIGLVHPTSGRVGDAVTVTGTGFGAAGTVGVSVDGMWARVTGSTGTTVTFEIPATDTTGGKDVLIGATTGLSSAGALTVLPDDGIVTVTPGTIPSYATGSAARVTLDGFGFGSAGMVKVGAAPATAYTASLSGTRISGVVVPTGTEGSMPIVVTPTGSSTPLRSAIRVTAPHITYLGSDPANDIYADGNARLSGILLDVPAAGGTPARIEGTGFGAGGTLTVGGTTVATTSWSDTWITFAAPAHAAGLAVVAVRPTGSTLSATRASGLRYSAPIVGTTISRIHSKIDLLHPARNQFDQVLDTDNAFTLTGTGLAGATNVILTDIAGAETDPINVAPTDVTATSLTFAAPRDLEETGWKQITVVTNLGTASVNTGVYYLDGPPPTSGSLTMDPVQGMCLKSSQPATGGGTAAPANVTMASSEALFGDAGTVTVDGVPVATDAYTASEIIFGFAGLAEELADPWGPVTILITPTDTSKPPLSANFRCALTPTVTTTVNGGTTPVTVAVGEPYTLGNTTTGFIGPAPFQVTAPGGYEYITEDDYINHNGQFGGYIRTGMPDEVGSYYVRVNRDVAQYAVERYRWLTEPSPVQITITGKPVTITPTSVNGSEFTYKGQLGDSTLGSTDDLRYTTSPATDPVTSVQWEHRNAACTDPNEGWMDGLPKDVSTYWCGGDGITPVTWEVRVRWFEMVDENGIDQSVYYTVTRPSVTFTMARRNVGVGPVRADRVYDGSTTAVLDDFDLTGVLEGDDVRLNGSSGGATFADATVGVDKTVTLASDVELTGQAAGNYVLSDPRPTVTGTIVKADAVLSLAAVPTSVLLTNNPTIQIVARVADTLTGQAPVGDAGVPPVNLTAETTDVCTIVGSAVTAVSDGVCVISGEVPASTNYNAATAATDPTSTVETVEIDVFGGPQAISVVADDLTVAYQDEVNPTAQITGLFDGDAINNVGFAYYRGTELLLTKPTEPGTYKIVPTGGDLSTETPSSYTNPGAFRYVAATLIITTVPPTISRLLPASGYVTGGTTVTITGTLLDTVRAVRVGTVTLRLPDFEVDEAGTSLTFKTPAGTGPVTVPVTLIAGTTETEDSFTYLIDPSPSPSVSPSTSPSASPSVSPSVSQSPSLSPSPSVTPTITPTPTVTPTPTLSVTPTPTPSLTPTVRPSVTPTVRPTVTPPRPTGPVQLNLNLNLAIDAKFVGARAALTGSGLRPLSRYVLTMYSAPVTIATGITDSTGSFRQMITMPGKACVKGGLHQLVLAGVAPDGTVRRDSSWIVLDDTCGVRSTSPVKPVNSTFSLRSFLFPYLSSRLTPRSKSVIRGLASSLRGAKIITITGYTQTGKTSKASIRANKLLARARANAVRDYLRSRGVTARMVTIGKGPVNPVSKKNQKLNRRVIIRVRF